MEAKYDQWENTIWPRHDGILEKKSHFPIKTLRHFGHVLGVYYVHTLVTSVIRI